MHQPPSDDSSTNPSNINNIAHSSFSLIFNHGLWPHDLFKEEFSPLASAFEPLSSLNKIKSFNIHHPLLSLNELSSSKPHPLSYFCPNQWKWFIIFPILNNTQKHHQHHVHFFQLLHHRLLHPPPNLSSAPIIMFDHDGQPFIDPPTHHHHNPPLLLDCSTATCHRCQLTFAFSTPDTPIPSVFPKSDADALTLQATLSTPSNPQQAVYKAWHTVFIVIQNALVQANYQPLPLDGKAFSGRIPWTPVSQKIWSHLGATKCDQSERPLLKLPCLDVKNPEGRSNRAKWCRALIELSIFLSWLKLVHPHLDDCYKTTYQVPFTLKPAAPWILDTLGGDNIPRRQPSSHSPLAIAPHASYNSLGIPPDATDEMVIYAYELQSSLYPALQFRFFHHLREICALRLDDSETLATFLVQSVSQGAVGVPETLAAWICIVGDDQQVDLSNEELIAAALHTKLEAAEQNPDEKSQLRTALRTLVCANPANQLLRALLDSSSALAINHSSVLSSSSKNWDMDLDKAYATLGNMMHDTDDELVWIAYTFAISDHPGQKNVLTQAVQTIAQHRDSQLLRRRLESESNQEGAAKVSSTGIVPYSPPAIVDSPLELPAGLDNIGNTCYLNSLLQYFFSVKPLRDVLLRFPDYAQDLGEDLGDPPEKEWKRVGGRVVSKPEVARSKQFALQLQNLFQEMIRTRQSAVTPERELAFLALVLPKDETHVSSSIDNHQQGNSSASTDATLVDERNSFIGPLNNPSASLTVHINSPTLVTGNHEPVIAHLDSPSRSSGAPALVADVSSPISTVLGKRKSESSDTEDDSAECSTRTVRMDLFGSNPSSVTAPNQLITSPASTAARPALSDTPPSLLASTFLNTSDTKMEFDPSLPPHSLLDLDINMDSKPSSVSQNAQDYTLLKPKLKHAHTIPSFTRLITASDHHQIVEHVGSTPSRSQTLPLPNLDPPLSTTHHADTPQHPVVIDLTREPAAPPPLPPRPNRTRSLAVTDNGSHMMFGRQNDVSECMDNCLFQIQAALDENKLLASIGEEGNIVKSLFYGRTRQSLMFDDPQGKVSMKEEAFAYLLVDVAEDGRDLYDGLDRVFDESEVDVENGKATRRVGLVHLPPILQIQLQRVQFDRSTHTVFKSNAYIKFEEKLRMDRYLEPEPDDAAGLERRARTNRCRKEIESLRGRAKELTASGAAGKNTTSVMLQDLHQVLTLTNPTPTLAEFFNDLIGPEEVDWLNEEAVMIEKELDRLHKQVVGLKEEVEEMWKMENRQGAEYKLVSLFMHRGTASGGHYWAVQRQLPEFEDRWIKYNDSTVSIVDPKLEVFNETSSKETANPYWLTYVRLGDEYRFEMLKRDISL